VVDLRWSTSNKSFVDVCWIAATEMEDDDVEEEEE
jgi:hypothetical protein